MEVEVRRAAPQLIEPAPHPETRSDQVRDWRLDQSLFLVVCVVLCALMVLLGASLYAQFANYRSAILHEVDSLLPVDHASIISYSRALDFAVAKTSALFLAFALVFVGALYVLRVAEAEFKLAASTGATKGSLQTSSPGLVMVTLGVLLIALVLNTKSEIDYLRAPGEPLVSASEAPALSGQGLERPALGAAPHVPPPDPN